MVLLSTKNLRSFAERSRKLLPHWIGPYPIIVHMVGNAAVELTLSYDMNIHPTFHVSHARLPDHGTEPVPDTYTRHAHSWLTLHNNSAYENVCSQIRRLACLASCNPSTTSHTYASRG
ncbi:hypothetical protein Vretimale_16865 [Volvox reticuliferus]|uniref:Tf2-1-like SH3-like domain-containing protein n=1 Tax=Volvox reticuliferus TaxID=1737510 RepID=A0A8J4LX79_9CHLO|nr:hypothetical protein Vretimale_16865 [Volvox reticuliferus]